VPEFPIQTVETAPDAARPSLEQLRAQVGFVPNLAATMATSPTLVGAFVATRDWTTKGTLTPLEREVVSLAAAFERHCSYCVAAHSAFAVGAGGDPVDVDAFRRGRQPGSDDRLAALHRFALAVLRSRGPVDPASLRELLAAGFSAEQSLEVVGVLAAATMANWTHALTEAPLDEPLAAWRWDPADPVTTPA
jgi:uncharacterized peroxidase-related enzyme